MHTSASKISECLSFRTFGELLNPDGFCDQNVDFLVNFYHIRQVDKVVERLIDLKFGRKTVSTVTSKSRCFFLVPPSIPCALPLFCFIVFIFQVEGRRNGTQFVFDKKQGCRGRWWEGWRVKQEERLCFHGGKISIVSLTTAAHQCVSSERPSRAETVTYAHTCKAGGSPGERRASGFPSTLYKKDTFFPLLPAHSNTTHVHEALPTYQRFCHRGQRVGGWGG